MIEKKKYLGSWTIVYFYDKIRKGRQSASKIDASKYYVRRVYRAESRQKKSNGNLVSLSISSIVEIKTRNETVTIFRWFSLLFC